MSRLLPQPPRGIATGRSSRVPRADLSRARFEEEHSHGIGEQHLGLDRTPIREDEADRQSYGRAPERLGETGHLGRHDLGPVAVDLLVDSRP